MAFRFRRPDWLQGKPLNILLWCVIIGLPLLVLVSVGQKPIDTAEVSYTSFLDRLDRGAFKSVTYVDNNSRVIGDLSTPFDTLGIHAKRISVELPVWNSDALLKRVEASGAVAHSYKNGMTAADVFRAMLPYILLFGFFVFVLHSLKGMRGSPFTGKGKGKMISEIPGIKFSDMAGAEEAKQELAEVVEFLKDPTLVTRLGGTAPKGALLIGPPGTGKTLLARAVAGEAARPFFSMSGSDFVEMYVGVGAARVRMLFEQARAAAPCIIFIDEIDAVGRQRGSSMNGGADEREQTLNQLLVEMDGFSGTTGIVVLAATNRPDILDPALLRPGRFDRQITIDPPDVKGREAILRVHMAKLIVDSDVDLIKIARGTPGMSGADLANVCNEAAMLAARRRHNSVGMKEFEDSRDKIMLGLERRSMVLSAFERKLTAYHEAGHALVALATPGADPIHKVTIIPRGRALGITASMPDVDRHTYTRNWIVGHLAMLFGGRAAEEIILGAGDVTTGAQNDILRATDLARRMVAEWGMSPLGAVAVTESGGGDVRHGGEGKARAHISEHTLQRMDFEVQTILEAAHQEARRVLTEKREDLETLAQALLSRETISREDLEQLVPHLHVHLSGAPVAGKLEIAPEEGGII